MLRFLGGLVLRICLGLFAFGVLRIGVGYWFDGWWLRFVGVDGLDALRLVPFVVF